MSDQNMFEGEITSDDKLWAALAYVFSPLVPIIILFLEEKKNRPFIKAHNVQALLLGVVLVILSIIISAVTLGIGGCFTPLLWILMLYYAYNAYQGKLIKIPVITDFVKNQGW